MGKYTRKEGRVWLPISIQVHHAVCDGFHVCRFLDMREMIESPCSGPEHKKRTSERMSFLLAIIGVW